MHIFSYLKELSYGRHETIGPNIRLTPAICRASRVIRAETLPLYAKTSAFIIQTDDSLHSSNNRVNAWLNALGTEGIPQVESLQLSRHWNLTQPSRWQGHVGFYIRLQSINKVWQCTSGTYPIANDMRGMRLESVDLLRHIVTQRLRPADAYVRAKTLSRLDVEFIVQAMELVALHPISTFDTEQSEGGRQRRREIWTTMEKKLFALRVGSVEQPRGFEPQPKSFHTPY